LRIRRLFCITSLFFAQASYAGGEISEAELALHTLKCNKGYSGDSCFILAEQTLCGRGYNEETSVFVNQAVSNYKSNCTKGHAQSCYDYSLFIMSCLPDTMDFKEHILNDYVPHLDGTMSCIISWPDPNFTTEEVQAEAISISIELLSKACSQNIVNGCLLLGELYSAPEVKKLRKAKQVWEKACSLQSQKGCELFENGSILSY
jgi:TPR repeat protein